MGRTIVVPVKNKLSSKTTTDFENIYSNTLSSDQIRWISKNAIFNLDFLADFVDNLTDRLKGLEEDMSKDNIRAACRDFDGMAEYIARINKAFGYFKTHIKDNQKSPA